MGVHVGMTTLHHYDLIFERSEVASPGVGVAIILSLLPKVSSHVPVHDRLSENDALYNPWLVARAHSATHTFTLRLVFPSSDIVGPFVRMREGCRHVENGRVLGSDCERRGGLFAF